jgi:hypothetical protein
MRTWKKLAFRTLAALGLLVLTPLTFSPADGVSENEMCGRTNADQCIREMDSLCTDGKTSQWDYYYLIVN